MKSMSLKSVTPVLLALMLCLLSQAAVMAQGDLPMLPPGGDDGGGGECCFIGGPPVGGGIGGIIDRPLPPYPCNIGLNIPCSTGALYFQELYNRTTKKYFYSADQGEVNNAVRNLGYIRTGGFAGFILTYQGFGTVPLHRFSGDFRFLYTTSYQEGVNAAQFGYTRYDGIAGYVRPMSSSCCLPVYRYELSNFRGKVFIFDDLGASFFDFGGTARKDGPVWRAVPLA